MKKNIRLLVLLLLSAIILSAKAAPEQQNASIKDKNSLEKKIPADNSGTSYLGFTVIAAIVTTCGTVLGLFLKDFLFVRYFENSREKRSVKAVSKRYKDPLLLSATELAGRIKELNTSYAIMTKAFTWENLFNKTENLEKNSIDDPYFIKYKMISTLYRFCAFFGWIEMYRQDITFLNSYSKKESNMVLEIIGNIKVSIADGRINKEPDWDEWEDVLIFREELRATGEGMIEVMKDQKSILGYGKFQQIISDYEATKKPIWVRPALNFFIDFKPVKDFRVKRMNLLLESLKELIECLDKDYYETNVKNVM